MNKVTYEKTEKPYISFAQIPVGALVESSSGKFGQKTNSAGHIGPIIVDFKDGTYWDDRTVMFFRLLQPGESITLEVEG